MTKVKSGPSYVVMPEHRSEPASTSFAELAAYLVKLAQDKAYGEVRVKFQAGQIVLVTVEQQFKPGGLPVAARSAQ